MTSEITLEISKTFSAAAQQVYDSWIKKDLLEQWSFPEKMSIFLCECDPKVQGKWRLGMRSPDGEEYIMTGVYKELNEPNKIVTTHCWEEDDGSYSPETLMTIDIQEVDGKTTMNFVQSGFASEESKNNHDDGWSSAFNKLQELF